MHANGSFIATCFMARAGRRTVCGAFIGTSTIGSHVATVFGILITSVPSGAGMPRAKRRWVWRCSPPPTCHYCRLRPFSRQPSVTTRFVTIACTSAHTSTRNGLGSTFPGTTTTTWDRIKKPTGVSPDLGSMIGWELASPMQARPAKPEIARVTPRAMAHLPAEAFTRRRSARRSFPSRAARSGSRWHP